MKRRPLLFLMITVLLLIGCGFALAAPAAAEEPLPSAEEQQQLLMAHYDEWSLGDGLYEPWSYAFTDLDRNGRLEVLVVSTQGSGIFTTAECWEVNESFDGLVRCTAANDEHDGTFWPELIQDSSFGYRDAAGRCHYLFTNLTRDGAAHYLESLTEVCLADGVLTQRVLASHETLYTDAENEYPTESYADEAGNPISAADFESAGDRAFVGCEKILLTLEWTTVSAPMESAGPAVVITKNPSSEAIAIGGKTWFIAHADNADSLFWMMVDPEGMVYGLDEAMERHPGLQLEELPQDTLAVSNVPASANGWGFLAGFSGPGGYAETDPAYLYVGDYVNLYSSVIQAYRDAYTTGNTDAQYAWEHGISEIIGYSQHVGYALKDLDKNGVPELIIAGLGTDDFSEGMVYELYTLVNNTPVQLALSQARDRYYLRTDGLLVNEGSGGAGFSAVILKRLNGHELTVDSAIITYFPGNAQDGCYFQQGGYSWEPRPEDIRISNADFQHMWEMYTAKQWVPPLTQIA